LGRHPDGNSQLIGIDIIGVTDAVTPTIGQQNIPLQLNPNSLMQDSISFRPLRRSDFPLLQQWLSAPHVAAWWGESLSLEAVDAKYGPRVDGTEPTHVFVIEYDGQPVGWIQWYFWSDYPQHALQLGAELPSAGIDLAIGEFPRIGLGLGPVAIREFLRQIVFAGTKICAVIADPAQGNLRSSRAFEKAGFTVTRTVQLRGEDFERIVVRMYRP
jgi:aminoglycoside 6'-N-acetyltransferase